MTDAVPVASRRPKRPPPSTFGVVTGLVVIVLTIATAASWRYGTGFSPITAVREVFRRENPVLRGIPNTRFGEMFSDRSRTAFIETLRLAIVASIAGVSVALPFALWSTTFGAPNRIVLVVARTVGNVIRSFPDILWAALFVGAVGIGALSGLLALFFFTIAVVTKLTADTLDGIDMGPVEAAKASGASHSQVLRTAVVPQILPAYTSYALYAFELNLRASIVLGFVGAGGIGQHLNYLRTRAELVMPDKWGRVWGLVFMFLIVVFVVDRVSTWLRRRLV